MEDIDFIFTILEYLAYLFIFVVGSVLLLVVVVFLFDIGQNKNAIWRNYPVIGHFRAIFQELGKFFRQYFFAMDREELPFNRAERNWAYRASQDVDNTSAFGSTRDLRPTGTVIFVNCPFPTLDEDAVPTRPTIIGPHCRQPYETDSLFNVSGMSFGALSEEAKLANVSLSVHTEPKDAAAVFERAKPKLAVYSHLIPPQITEEELKAATPYDGNLVVAHDLMMVTIGDTIEISDRPILSDESFEKSKVLK